MKRLTRGTKRADQVDDGADNKHQPAQNSPAERKSLAGQIHASVRPDDVGELDETGIQRGQRERPNRAHRQPDPTLAAQKGAHEQYQKKRQKESPEDLQVLKIPRRHLREELAPPQRLDRLQDQPRQRVRAHQQRRKFLSLPTAERADQDREIQRGPHKDDDERDELRSKGGHLRESIL